MKNRRLKSFVLAVLLLGSNFFAPRFVAAEPKNIILFIGGGMGTEQIKAAGYAINGASNTLIFEKFPYRSLMRTSASGSAVPDSSASATAMATGVKVKNGVISQRIPGNGGNLSTVLELFKSEGKKTGLVTTADITDGTPASFAAHQPSHNNHLQIQRDILTGSKPNIIFGASHFTTQSVASQNNYKVITTRSELFLTPIAFSDYLFGQFSKENFLEWGRRRAWAGPLQPTLPEMTRRALEGLSGNPKGFFLLVENGLIENAGSNQIPPGEDRTKLLVDEVAILAQSVDTAVEWARTHPDTLIVVTSDLECGDFNVLDSKAKKGVIPNASWGSDKRTDKQVGVFGWGNGSALDTASATIRVRDNTDIFKLLRSNL